MDGGIARYPGASRERSGDTADGCAYPLDAGGVCGNPRRAGSAYCETHHALCHIVGGSARERRQIREIEGLAGAVGGRRGRDGRAPPDPFLKRLERVARGFSRADRSRNVPEGDRR